MKINVPHVAKLANLTLKPEEEKKFEKQLSDILTYVDKLKEVDTKNVELENVMREDEPTPSLTQDEALSNVKNQHNGLFKVKAILTE
ncbi:MAG: Aspartyl/glutamyl-tRNA(Asn/Gln) amidotransferase subunit C [Candidatus Levybacteria bacterium GW2011_GWC2_37_7]|nr:MAG: Aspartyl/glutamyl-tRNA(Asn/Gln) amidotransferase subunit C [Candidatus Levybacteria bacterium GW2011_GWC2_37_7]